MIFRLKLLLTISRVMSAEAQQPDLALPAAGNGQ